MSKRKKIKRKRVSGNNLHHVLYYRRNWDRGFKALLRKSFIYSIPISVHDELHKECGPVPPIEEYEAKVLWEQFKLVNHDMRLFEGLGWLVDHAPNEDFKEAILAQKNFLRSNLGRS